MNKLGLIVLSFLASTGLIVSSYFAQENQTNITTATNESGIMMGNQTNQTEGENQTQGPLEQLGETLGGIFGGGNQSQ
jgi:hypothetical protein